MSDAMQPDQIAEEFRKLNSRLDTMETRFDTRFGAIEKHMVTKSDVYQAVFQGLAFGAALIVGTIVSLNALGAFS